MISILVNIYWFNSKPKDHYFHDVCFRGNKFLNVTYFDPSEAKRMQAVPGLRRIKAGWVWKLTGSRESQKVAMKCSRLRRFEKQLDGPVCKVLALEAVPAAAAVFQKSVEWNNLTDVIQAGASRYFALGELDEV